MAEQSDDVAARHREAFLLWQLFAVKHANVDDAQAAWLTKGKANSPITGTKGIWRPLKFFGATPSKSSAKSVNTARDALTPHYIETNKVGRSVFYRITPAGEQRLARLPQHPDLFIKTTGAVLNALRALTSIGDAVDVSRPASQEFSKEAIRQAILNQVDELVRGQYSRSQMVPIHQVRAAVSTHLGNNAASHDQFDPILWQLGDDRVVRLVTLSDEAEATEQELSDSLKAADRYTFYIRKVAQ